MGTAAGPGLFQMTDFTDTHYCKFSRRLLTLIGLWDPDDPPQRVRNTILLSMLVTLGAIPQLSKLITSHNDINEITATIPPHVTTLASITKFVTLLVKKKQIKKLQAEMNDHWRSLKVEREIQIMERYTEVGRFYAKIYAMYTYGATCIFILLIFEIPILNAISPLNETRPLKLVYPAEYFVIDTEKYFTLITCQMIVIALILVTTLIASDAMFIVYIQYTCGIYAVLGHRLKQSLYESVTRNAPVAQKRKVYHSYIVECVNLHRTVLKFVDLIESIFSVSHFIQLGFNVICMSVTLLEIIILLGQLEIIRYIMYVIAQIFHLLCTNFEGQQLLDHSNQALHKIYTGLWYEAPIEAQKLLLFMHIRTSKPSQLTAIKTFVFSLQSFSMIVQNCVSYFMVLASFR